MAEISDNSVESLSERRTRDTHLDSKGITSRKLSDRFYVVMNDFAREHDQTRGSKRAESLMDRLYGARARIAEIREKNEMSEDELMAYIYQKSERLSRVRAMYLELGIARMLLSGDWDIDRIEKLYDELGIVSLPQIATSMQRFLERHGLEVEADPGHNNESARKLIHFDMGCGNGSVNEFMRHQLLTDSDESIRTYWEQYGYADCIYFTLNDLLHNLLRDDLQLTEPEERGLHEFLALITRLITRRIHFSQQYPVPTISKEAQILYELPQNPNRVREILASLGDFIPNLDRLYEYTIDREFLLDARKEVSPECRVMIDRYFGREYVQMEAYILFVDTNGVIREVSTHLRSNLESILEEGQELVIGETTFDDLYNNNFAADGETYMEIPQKGGGKLVLFTSCGVASGSQLRGFIRQLDTRNGDPQEQFLDEYFKPTVREQSFNDKVDDFDRNIFEARSMLEECDQGIESHRDACAQHIAFLEQEKSTCSVEIPTEHVDAFFKVIERIVITESQLDLVLLEGSHHDNVLEGNILANADFDGSKSSQDYEAERDQLTAKLGDLRKEYERLCTEINRAISADIYAYADTIFEAHNIVTAPKQSIIRKKNRVATTLKYYEGKKEDLVHNTDNLSRYITIHPHNVLFGDFLEFDKKLPTGALFNVVHSCRSLSHAPDDVYEQVVIWVAERLRQGGAFFDDGKRESYTRFERIDELKRIQSQLGPEYRVSIIGHDDGTCSACIERCLYTDDSEVFFLDECADECLKDDCNLYPVADFEKRWPEITFQNQIIRRLKHWFVSAEFANGRSEKEDWFTDATVDYSLGEKWRMLVKSRAFFKDVFTDGLLTEKDEDRLTTLLRRHAFDNERWQSLRLASPSSREYIKYLEQVFDEIVDEIIEVRERIDHVFAGARLLSKPDSRVSVVPPAGQDLDAADLPAICVPRSFFVTDLPRNSQVPSLDGLSMEQASLVEHCLLLREKNGGFAPLVVIEFSPSFINPLMRDFLSRIFGENLELCVEFVSVSEEGPYPEQQEGRIYMLGGGDVSIEEFPNFIQHWCVPFVSSVKEQGPVRGFGFGFGAQCLCDAFGSVNDCEVVTEEGALQFGAFPTYFFGQGADHLDDKPTSVLFTRSKYTTIPDYLSNPDVTAIAHELCPSEDRSQWLIDNSLPPVGFTLHDGIMALQLHPEILVTDPVHRQSVQRYLQSRSELHADFPSAQWVPKSQHGIYKYNVRMAAEDVQSKKRHWLDKDIGFAFMIPAIDNYAQDLIAAL